MAHEITQSDGLVLTGKPAWHGLGVVVESAPTAREALGLAGLDWMVEQWPLSATDGQRRQIVETHVLNVRADTQAQLGLVGEGYTPVQNFELAEFADALGEDGAVKIESAGSIRGGQRVWFLVRGESVHVTPYDRVEPYIMLANGHDGSLALTVQPTTVRVVCSNTLHMALGSASTRTIRLKHIGDMSAKIDAARQALWLFTRQREEFTKAASALNAREMAREDLQRFWVDVYSECVKPIPASPTTSAEREMVAESRRVLSQWASNFDADRRKVHGAASAWTALNAATQWMDHQRTVRGNDDAARRDARMYANVWGLSADMKGTALRKALALV